MTQDPFKDYVLIQMDSFPYYMSMIGDDLVRELTTNPLGYASLMPRGVMPDSKDIIQIEKLPYFMKQAAVWMEKNWSDSTDTSDPWRFKGVEKEELLLKAMRRYMSFYMECIDSWGNVIDKSIKEEYPEAFAAFMEAFQIILFVPSLNGDGQKGFPVSAVEVDLNVLYQKAIDPKTEGEGWMYVDP